MRALPLLALLAGCFNPSPKEGFACFGQERWCPDPLTCQPDNTCRSEPGGPGDGGVDGPDDGMTGGPANIAFVTSGVFTALSLNGVAGADKKCEDLGIASGHPGRYVAWLSTAASSALQRLGSASGWVRVDGRPFAASQAALLAGEILYPLRKDENNNDVAGFVMTGTSPEGLATENCVDLTSGSSADLMLIGRSDADVNRWTNTSEAMCSDAFHLYCLQADNNTTVAINPASGLRTFLSSPFTPGGGVTAADAQCKADATANSLGNRYVAGLATTTETVRGRIGTPLLPWVRVDGVETTANFFDFDGAIAVTATGKHVDDQVFSGALHPDQVANSGGENCNNWSNGTTALLGQSSIASRDEMFGKINGNCAPKRVYCFEF